LSASTATIYIFNAPTCTTTIITLAEFQHFIVIFRKKFLTLPIPLKDGIGGERRLEDRVKAG
jgi:hypothetical protein